MTAPGAGRWVAGRSGGALRAGAAVGIGLLVLGLLVLGALLLGGGGWPCAEPTTLLIVRHADRAGSADALSALGERRAAELAHVGQGADVSAIYHSDTARARATAAPLASALGLVPRERPAGDVAGLAREILAQHRGQHVLVVGHGNTVPQLIRAVGGPALPDLDHDDYDNLFVLTACRCWPRSAELVRLQYGAASP